MRKTITEPARQREIRVCDLCEKQMDCNYTCYICRKEMCMGCSRLLFHGVSGKPNQYIEMAIHVCKPCCEHEAIIERIQAAIDGANKDIAEWMDLWRKAAKAGVKP